MPSLPLAPPAGSSSADRTAGNDVAHWVVLGVFAVLIAFSFALDSALATATHGANLDYRVKHFGSLVHTIKLGGYFGYTATVAAGLCILHPLHWRAALFELLCGLLAGANFLLKWIVGRTRPFKLPPTNLAQPFHLTPFTGGLAGLFAPSGDLSFVSGHTTLAFATAMGLLYLLPRQRWIVGIAFAIAGLVFLERVLENAHWLSDATCGAAVGMGLVAMVARIQPIRRAIVV